MYGTYLCFLLILGYYFSGDGAYRQPDGYYQITGRMDDVVNVSGHRLGTAEIEDIMVSSIYHTNTLSQEHVHVLIE